MYVVTGGAGFVGSNLIRGLNELGISDVIVVDERAHRASANLKGCQIADYYDKHDFLRAIHTQRLPARRVQAILHQGACADTMERDESYILENNYRYSQLLLQWAIGHKIPFIYASSAAVYGSSSVFSEQPGCEQPQNAYARSKWLLDRYVRSVLDDAQSSVVGLRYFNVYGPGEADKGRMASIVYQLYQQIEATGQARLFAGSDGYAAGEQRRDWVYISDVVSVNLAFLFGPPRKGIFNVGTGESHSFNEVARCIIRQMGGGEIVYIPFPEALRGRYQSHTQADISALRAAGYREPFVPLEEGIARYCQALSRRAAAT